MSFWLAIVEPGGNWKTNPYFAFVNRNHPLLSGVAVAVAAGAPVVAVAAAVVAVGVAAGAEPDTVMSTQNGLSYVEPMPNKLPKPLFNSQ